MRAQRARKKKLIVAFHFQYANQAAWKCDTCRLQGLEKQRRCGFLPPSAAERPRPVWVRRQAIAMSCPRSLITAESLEIVERFFVWKAGGPVNFLELPARLAEGLFLLEREWKTESEHE